jgi:hypothetical protein
MCAGWPQHVIHTSMVNFVPGLCVRSSEVLKDIFSARIQVSYTSGDAMLCEEDIQGFEDHSQSESVIPKNTNEGSVVCCSHHGNAVSQWQRKLTRNRQLFIKLRANNTGSLINKQNNKRKTHENQCRCRAGLPSQHPNAKRVKVESQDNLPILRSTL